MIKPVLQNEAFLADVEEARQDRHNLHLWWLGQSGFLVQWNDRHLLLDPYLSDSLTKKYAASDKPHVRMTERVVSPGFLKSIDVVTSSHSHTDHLDAETLIPLMRANPKMDLLIPEANRPLVVDRLQTMIEFPRGIDAGESKTLHGFCFHAVPAAHNEIERDEWGRHKFLGYVIECGPWTIYHAGDTRPYAEMQSILRQFTIHVALLPINGDRPERRVAGNLEPNEAAQLARDIGAVVAIPCHYDMFDFNTADPAGFEEACRQIGQRCRILRAGERWSSAELNL
jgi:L-ascorbate metabolism protein UlaG (beta-lactamase superfamily)